MQQPGWVIFELVLTTKEYMREVCYVVFERILELCQHHMCFSCLRALLWLYAIA
jgi:hypothetical protein